MGRIVLPREEFTRPDHPAVLKGRSRVDHPVVDALQLGVGAWEGDPRLVLYANTKTDQWELWRLEHDGKYRICGRQARPGPGQTGQRLGEDLLNTLLAHLVTSDLRRGNDPLADLDARNDAHDAEQDRDFSDFVMGDFADRLKHALKKDGALNHVTGV